MKSCASPRGMPARLAQAEVAHAVGQAEVDHLGHRALVAGDLGGVLLEHPRGGLAVDVGAALERLLEMHVARHVGQDAQLDLAVVGGEQHAVGVAGHERVPDLAAQLGPDGDVLEVRVDRRQPAGRRDGLLEGGVQPLGGRVEQQRQRLDVGRLELGVQPPVEQRRDHRVRRRAGPPAPTRRWSSRSWCACHGAGPARRTAPAPAAWGCPG